MDTCSPRSLALVGVTPLILGVGLCNVSRSDWTSSQRPAIVVYWVILGFITALICPQALSAVGLATVAPSKVMDPTFISPLLSTPNHMSLWFS